MQFETRTVRLSTLAACPRAHQEWNTDLLLCPSYCPTEPTSSTTHPHVQKMQSRCFSLWFIFCLKKTTQNAAATVTRNSTLLLFISQNTKKFSCQFYVSFHRRRSWARCWQEIWSTPSRWGYQDRRPPITTFTPEGWGADLYCGHKHRGGLCRCCRASETHAWSLRVAADLFSAHRVCSTGLLGAAAVQHLSFCLGTFISTAEGNTVWTVNSSPRSCKYLDSTHCFSSINLIS